MTTHAAQKYGDLREWIAAARRLGEVRDVRGATWEEDIGRILEQAVTDAMREEAAAPAE